VHHALINRDHSRKLAALRHLIADVSDDRTVGVDAFAMAPAGEIDPRVHDGLQPIRIAFENLRIIGLSHAVAHRIEVDVGLVGRNRHDHAHVLLDQLKVREDAEVRIAFNRDEFGGALRSVGRKHRGDIGFAPRLTAHRRQVMVLLRNAVRHHVEHHVSASEVARHG